MTTQLNLVGQLTPVPNVPQFTGTLHLTQHPAPVVPDETVGAAPACQPRAPRWEDDPRSVWHVPEALRFQYAACPPNSAMSPQVRAEIEAGTWAVSLPVSSDTGGTTPLLARLPGLDLHPWSDGGPGASVAFVTVRAGKDVAACLAAVEHVGRLSYAATLVAHAGWQLAPEVQALALARCPCCGEAIMAGSMPHVVLPLTSPEVVHVCSACAVLLADAVRDEQRAQHPARTGVVMAYARRLVRRPVVPDV